MLQAEGLCAPVWGCQRWPQIKVLGTAGARVSRRWGWTAPLEEGLYPRRGRGGGFWGNRKQKCQTGEELGADGKTLCR